MTEDKSTIPNPFDYQNPKQENMIRAAQVLSSRLEHIACSLLATREYNGPNRRKLISDANEIMKAVDIAALTIVRQMIEQEKQEAQTPKIIVP